MQGVLSTTRELCEVTPTERHPEFASQMLEYAPLRSLSYLQRWLKSSIDLKRALQTSVELQSCFNTLLKLPAMGDCFFYTQTAVASIGLSSDFASSQVRILVIRYYLLCVFADNFVIESLATSQ